MDAIVKELVKTKNQVTIVHDETLRQNSTLELIQCLNDAGFVRAGRGAGTIVCIQSRNVATSSFKTRWAENLSSNVGGIIRQNNSSATQTAGVKIMSDFSLLMEIRNDQMLKNYSTIIIDMAHERSVFSDILLGMIKRMLKSDREKDLKLIIVSTSIDVEQLTTYFQKCTCSNLKITGRTFPVDVLWMPAGTKKKDRNIVKEVEEKVVEIHQHADKGDILVFITTPDEAKTGCASLSQHALLQPMQLHNMLRVEEQQCVFDPSPSVKRKVIFATNFAETSMAIPGIRYVVDTGLVKEKRYDTGQNISYLEVGPISKRSAEIRRVLAGGTKEGKCYRLYDQTDYESQDNSNVPEIMRVQLSQAILILIALGITKPLDFDFVISPRREALEAAMAEVISIGAVVGDTLTELGTIISTLPLRPILGRLVIEGIDRDLGMEAVVIAAVSSMSEPLFLRIGSNNQKDKSNLSKIPFCQASGDMVTFIELYKQWMAVDEKEKNNWCVQHCINQKAMQRVAKITAELLDTLKHIGIKVEHRFMDSNADTTTAIRKIIFKCFKSNLCMSAGKRRAGYIIVDRRLEDVHIHPASALSRDYLDQEAKWLVYGDVWKTTRTYIVNLTPVEESWVVEAIGEGSLHVDLNELMNMVLVNIKISNFGDQCIKWLIKDHYANCNELRDKLMKLCRGTNVILHVEKERCLLDVYCGSNYRDDVKEKTFRELETVKQEFINKVHKVEVPKACVKLSVSHGHEVQSIEPERCTTGSSWEPGLVYRFEWCRRMSKGVANLQFKAAKDVTFAKKVLQEMKVGGKTSYCQICKDSSVLKITDLAQDVDEEVLTTVLTEKLGDNYATVINVKIERGVKYNTSQDDLEDFRKSLKEYVDSMIPDSMKDAYCVDVLSPRDDNVYLRSNIVFKNLTDGKSFVPRFEIEDIGGNLK